MIQIGEETYLLAAEAARHMNISRPKFYRSYKKLLKHKEIGQMAWKYYRMSDINQLHGVKSAK